jgi:hypothetical protein
MRFRSLAFALALTLAFSAGVANAQVVVTFNDTTETPTVTVGGATAIIVPLPGEDFQVILMNAIAPGGPNFSDVFALRDPASQGGAISDLVYFQPFNSIPGALQIEFVSDTEGVTLVPNPNSNLYGSAVETGASVPIPLPTDVVNPNLSVNVVSDLDAVPEPSVLALAGTGGLLGLGLWGYRRRKA